MSVCDEDIERDVPGIWRYRRRTSFCWNECRKTKTKSRWPLEMEQTYDLWVSVIKHDLTVPSSTSLRPVLCYAANTPNRLHKACNPKALCVFMPPATCDSGGTKLAIGLTGSRDGPEKGVMGPGGKVRTVQCNCRSKWPFWVSRIGEKPWII